MGAYGPGPIGKGEDRAGRVSRHSPLAFCRERQHKGLAYS